MSQQQKQYRGMAGVALVLLPLAVAAESTALPTVLVTSERQPRTSQNVTRLDEEDLTRSGERELNGVLEGQPSVNTPHGMKGGFTSLTLRGAGGGMGLVNIDGIPLHTTIPGAFSLDLFPAETFGAADIVRGSGAMLSFGRTLGGTINLHSRDAVDDGARLHVEGGSFGSLRETGSASLGMGSHRLNLVAGRDDAFDGTHWADPRRGNPERDRFHAHQLGAHLVSEPIDAVRWDSSLYYIDSDTDVDSTGIYPNGRFGLADDPNGWLRQEIWLAQSTARVESKPGWRSELQLGYTQHRASAFLGGVHGGFTSQLTLARWKNSHGIGGDGAGGSRFQVNWGGEGLYESGASLDGLFRGRRGTGSGFLDVRAAWERWSGVLAVRADHYDDYGSHAVFHAGSNWQLNPKLEWYLSGGTGFRPPSFNEMLMPFYGNPRLQPEKGASGETGVRWYPTERTTFNLGYFYNRFDDLIQVSLVPSGLYIADNVPHARIQGLEAQWNTRWSAALTTGIDYTWSHGENLDTRNPLARNPEHIARFWGEWKFDGLPVALWGQGVYRGPSFDNEGADPIADAFYLDLQLSYRVDKTFNVYLRGENLTDNRNPQVLGRGTPGAAVYGGFR
ncbi:MAG: TonB-dependent receptor, partial [Methylococcaceae bacterium]|nr:TonB-dependent receptor [Methylococcaceae bacterium]